MFERFTDRARRVVVLAQDEARGLGHDHIDTEHILLALVDVPDGIAGRALSAAGQGRDTLLPEIERQVGRGSGMPPGHVPFSRDAKKNLELALREALQLGHNYIGTEHVLLGMIRVERAIGTKILIALDVDLPELRRSVLQLLEAATAGSPDDRTMTLTRVEIVQCALCGRRPPDSGVVIEGRAGGQVCEHCVRAAAELLASSSDFTEDQGETGLRKLPPPDLGG